MANTKNYKQLQHDLNLKNVDGFIRRYGRLKNAPITSDMKHPIFLPRDSEFTDLVIYYHHSLVIHNGVKETLNQRSSMFWVPKARNYIKKLIRRCHLCKRFEGLPYSYPEAPPLPLIRLNVDHVFKFTGVEYAGPLYVKNIYEGNNLYKVWIFLYTCCSTRSLFLDLVPDFLAQSCVRSLQRFKAIRGAPTKIIFKNGSQFISKITQDFISSRGILWHFNAAAAPWWGGCFERLVASTKRCLRKVIPNARLTYEELLNILAEVETVINNRPNTFTYEMPGDTPLTPNHMLYGRTMNFKATKEDLIVQFKYT